MSTTPNSLLSPVRRLSLATRLLALACALIGAAASAAELAAPRTVTIAVVRDGPSSLLDGIDTAFRAEARTLTAGRATLVFKDDPAFDAGWRDGGAAALDAALTDPAIDCVFALGTRVTGAASARPLSKPVFGTLVQEADLVPLPIGADGRSTKGNFAVVAFPSRAADQLSDLRALVSFTSLQIVIDEFLAPDRAALEAWRSRLAQSLHVPVRLVPAATQAGETLAALGSDGGAVLLFPCIRMDELNRAALLSGLSARKFPVLGFLGRPDVEAGALAGLLPDARAALARRLAVNLDQLIAGAPVASLPLRVNLPAQLYYNEATATAIGFSPDFDALTRAVVVGHSAPSSGPPLNFVDALAAAAKGNFDFMAQQSATESSRQSLRSAKGVLLPQLSLSQNFSQIDRDRAAASGGAQAQTSYRASVGVSQVVLDDESFTRVRIARESHRQAGYVERAERLDTLNDTGQAYLQLLSAEAALRVAEENFQVTQHNLELAQLRQRVGTSGPEEGYRFESQAAQQRAELVDARAQVDRARVAFNRVLGVDVGTRWQLQDVTLEDPAFSFTTSRVIALVHDPRKLDRFRAFAAIYAANHSPDVAALQQGLKTSELTAREKSRRRFTPKVSASFNYSRALHQDYAGPSLADQLSDAGLPVHTTAADRNDWTLGVTASIPIFSGGTLTAEARKARADARRAEFSLASARESVMAQTQAALFAAESAYANITHSRRAADLAAQNLQVVQDKYEQGSVSIVTLLDAQNAAFAQRQSADAAVYNFLSQLLQFQRALGWIEAAATDAEKEAWLHEIEQAVAG